MSIISEKVDKNNQTDEGRLYPFGLSIELHRHDGSGAVDLTPYFSSMSVRMGLSAPWEEVDIRLTIYVERDGKGRGLLNAYSPAPGDWIIINSFTERHNKGTRRSALSLTFVSSVEMNVSTMPDGRIDAFSISVSSVSWFSVTGSNQVYVALQARQTVGTLFARGNKTNRSLLLDTTTGGKLKTEAVRSWDDLVAAILAGFDNSFNVNAVGLSLSKLWVALGAMRVPPSLVSMEYTAPDGKILKKGGYIGDLIPVVYDDSTRKQYAPRLTLDPVPGWSINGLNSIYPQGQSVLDIILGTFLADTNMVELYPTLEPFDVAEPESGARAGVTPLASDAFLERMALSAEDDVYDITRSSDGQEGTLYIFDELEVTNEEAVDTYDSTKAARTRMGVGSPASALAAYLGVNPVVVYRVKPWRTEELEGYQVNKSSPIKVGSYGNKLGVQQIDKNIFRGVTWNKKIGDKIIHGYRVDGAVSGWSASQRDTEHINCVSVGLPTQTDSIIGFLSEAGLPIVASDSVDTFGLRHFRPTWPFWPPDIASNTPDGNSNPVAGTGNTDFLVSLYTVALQAMQFMGAADRFVTGTVTLSDFFPELRPGMTAEIRVEGITSPEFPYLTCYIDSVTHSIQVDRTGKYRASTSIGYSRGAVDPKYYKTQFVSPTDDTDPIEVPQDAEQDFV